MFGCPGPSACAALIEVQYVTMKILNGIGSLKRTDIETHLRDWRIIDTQCSDISRKAVSAWNFTVSHEAFGNFDPVSALERMAKQRTIEAQGGERFVIKLLPSSVEEAKKTTEDIDVLEATEYYKTSRGQVPNGCTSSLFSFNSAALAWDAFSHAEVLMSRPLMAVVGDRPGGFGAYRDAMEIYGRAGSKDKHVVVLPGVSHYMLYDKPEAVKLALERVLPFLKEHLGD